MDWWALFFSFRGRINRAKYWLALLILCIGSVVVRLIGWAFGDAVPFQISAGLFDLAFFVSSIAVSLKRLHDRDRSAWWLPVFYLGPVLVAVGAGGLLWVAADTFVDARYFLFFLVRLCFLGGMALGLWGLVEIGFRRGTAGYNRFGADPLANYPRPVIGAVQRAR